MKKIGICTLYYQNRNYGANLQAYALRYTLEKLGVNAELVPYYYRTRVRRLLSSIKQSLKKNSISKNVEKRNRVIDKFNNLIPHSKVYYSNTIHTMIVSLRVVIKFGIQIGLINISHWILLKTERLRLLMQRQQERLILTCRNNKN